jgi:hypothetical protein
MPIIRCFNIILTILIMRIPNNKLNRQQFTNSHINDDNTSRYKQASTLPKTFPSPHQPTSSCFISQILFIHQISKDFDKESDEYKWVKNILPTEYLNTLLDAQPKPDNPIESKNKISIKKRSSIDLPNDNTSDAANDLANYLESLKVLIININDKGFDCPGMLSEEKVLQEYEYLNTPLKHQQQHQQRNNTMKKIHSEIILDDRSSSDKLENNNQSISSSNDDDDVDDDDDVQNDVCQDVADGLSEFNFSERDTPIMSGRDTPSSYSHEDIRRNSSNNQINNNTMNINHFNGNNSNLSRLPVTVQKENREDINDKFCKFEINKGLLVPFFCLFGLVVFLYYV